MSPEPRNPWFHRPRPQNEPRARLICFPYAGGAASTYHGWPAGLPSDVEVVALEFPGRAFRLREPGFTRMVPLLEALELELSALLDRPYTFFGHSMGAAIAYELTQRFFTSGRRLPDKLLVSARRAPHLAVSDPPLFKLPLEEFIAALVRRYNTPEHVVTNPDLQQLVLPALRADMELLETWESPLRPPLPVPICAYGGESDVGVPRSHVEAWRQHTTGSFELSMIPGDHLFVHSASRQLLGLISRALAA